MRRGFRYRGVHLDVARNFQSKATVKKLLDLMAFYKLNRLHWHLTDDEGWRIEIRALPELTDVGARRGHTLDEANHLVPSHGSGPFADDATSPGNGFYSQDDFVEILQYAHARHITVIPELDFPGHARAAIKAMEARHRRLMERRRCNRRRGIPAARARRPVEIRIGANVARQRGRCRPRIDVSLSLHGGRRAGRQSIAAQACR